MTTPGQASGLAKHKSHRRLTPYHSRLALRNPRQVRCRLGKSLVGTVVSLPGKREPESRFRSAWAFLFIQIESLLALG